MPVHGGFYGQPAAWFGISDRTHAMGVLMGTTICVVVAGLALLIFIVVFTKRRPVTARGSGIWAAGSGTYPPFNGDGHDLSGSHGNAGGCGGGGGGGCGGGGGGCGGGN